MLPRRLELLAVFLALNFQGVSFAQDQVSAFVQPPLSSAQPSAEQLPCNWKAVAQSISLVDSLKAADWQCDPCLALAAGPGGFVTSAGLRADEALGQPAALLREYGCLHMVTKRFKRTQRAVVLNLYCFRTTDGAFGAYSTMREGASTVVVRGDASSEDDESISIWRGNYFVRLSTTAEDDEIGKQLASQLADSLSASIDEHAGLPRLFFCLPVLDRVAGSEKFFMGPLSARRYFAVPFIDDLSLDKSGGAAFADYQFPQPEAERMKLLLVDYEDPALARSVYDGYVSALSEVHKTAWQTAGAQTFKLGDSYLYCRLSGNRLSIIAGARRKQSPLMLSRQMSY